MRFRHVVVSGFLSVLPVAAFAQAPQFTAKTPAECSKQVTDWRTAQVNPARDAYLAATGDAKAAAQAKYTAALSGATTESVKMSAFCAERFKLSEVPSADLVDLITLYMAAKDTAGARKASDKAFAAKDLTPRRRGTLLMMRMSQEVASYGNTFALLPEAEKYVKMIDALPDSLSDIKIQAHNSMAGRYDYLDVAPGLEMHARAIIDLENRIARPNRISELSSAYLHLARAFADRLHPDSALKILDAAEKDLNTPAVTTAFKSFRERYALIGTKAANISAQWWFNNPTSPAPLKVGDGKVTLIEFSAHWCVPCKNSYPGMVGLAERYAKAPFEGVLITDLYGYIGTRQGLTPEQEVEADREYFLKEHALPFKIAINGKRTAPALLPPTPEALEAMQATSSRDYKVAGIPQIVIVDKKGVIRQIVTGWDSGNTERFTKYIDGLLKEK